GLSRDKAARSLCLCVLVVLVRGTTNAETTGMKAVSRLRIVDIAKSGDAAALKDASVFHITPANHDLRLGIDLIPHFSRQRAQGENCGDLPRFIRSQEFA